MIWIGIILAVLILGFALVSPPPEEKKTGNSVQTIELDVPDPEMVSPERFLSFVEETPNEYLWQVQSQLDNANKLKNIVYKRAMSEKQEFDDFDKQKYLTILQKLEEGLIDEQELNIPNDYSLVSIFDLAGGHIPHRKEYIIFDVEEGDEVILKPEPHNTYDKNAIAIFHKKALIGYVPRKKNIDIREEIKFNFKAYVADIIYQDDYISVCIYLYRNEEKNTKPEYFLSSETLTELRSRKIESKYLRPKKDAENINMFYKKKVVITGTFDRFPDRNDLAIYFYESGADIDVGITERVDYLIAGENAGWRKLEKAEEYGIDVFSEDEIIKILGI
ncbi:MAG: hypothetical protein CSA38_02045 [Flavobacteriales bacterium]|nr:MAG: hypothetical protein CSA38_02045 [Flavobacteriales bacterium]